VTKESGRKSYPVEHSRGGREERDDCFKKEELEKKLGKGKIYKTEWKREALQGVSLKKTAKRDEVYGTIL